MHRVGSGALAALVVSFPLGSTNSAYATTIASFTDPSPGSPHLFEVSHHHNAIGGLWSGAGLTLDTLNGTFTDVRFLMPTIGFNSSFVTGPGSIQFRKPNLDLILKIDFNQAHLSDPFSFGATAFMNLDEVTFTGQAVNPPGVQPGTGSFTFAFANQTEVEGGYTATAAFVASGELVPEPSTLLFLGGLPAAALMRRKR